MRKYKPGSIRHEAYVRGYTDGYNSVEKPENVSLIFCVGIGVGIVLTAACWLLAGLL